MFVNLVIVNFPSYFARFKLGTCEREILQLHLCHSIETNDI